jgi:hypothetical protein
MFWHADILLGNDLEISNYTKAVTRQRAVNSNKEMVFSVRSMLRYYKQGQLAELVTLWGVGWWVSEWVK